MDYYEKFLWGLSLWTVLEGAMVALVPGITCRITRKLFPRWGNLLEMMEITELRKMGAVELIFGLLLGGYLLVFAG